MGHPRFMRLVDDRIEVAIKTFVKDDVSVRFAANIHDGSQDYWDSIFGSLEDRERVFYEKIGEYDEQMPDSLRPYRVLFDVWSLFGFRPAPREGFTRVGHELKADKKGWVRCDVRFTEVYEQFQVILPDRENVEQYILRIYNRYLDEHYDTPADNKRFFELLTTFFSEDPIGNVLVHFRNTHLIECIKSSLSEGIKRLGILYGASHGDEVEAFLLNEASFSLGDEIWVLNRA